MFTLSELLVVGAVGFILLGRKDLPMFSRVAGRVLGSGVRGVRRMRKSVEEAAREGEVASEMKGLQDLKKDVTESVDKVRSFSQTLRDELRPPNLGASPEVKLSGRPGGKEHMYQGTRESSSAYQSSGSGRTMEKGQKVSVKQGAASSGSGADIICSTIEESALSRRESEMAGLKGVTPESKST